QAEDGIRDRNVTGVQTCALPISLGRRCDLRVLAVSQQASQDLAGGGLGDLAHEYDAPRALERREIGGAPTEGVERLEAEAGRPRSEERRVGKGGRAGGCRERVR